jgi:uncharacterized protein HemY
MAEYVVHDHHDDATGGSSNFLIGVIILAVVVLFLIFYGLPLMRNMGAATTPQVNVPGKVDVNLNQK